MRVSDNTSSVRRVGRTSASRGTNSDPASRRKRIAPATDPVTGAAGTTTKPPATRNTSGQSDPHSPATRSTSAAASVKITTASVRAGTVRGINRIGTSIASPSTAEFP